MLSKKQTILKNNQRKAYVMWLVIQLLARVTPPCTKLPFSCPMCQITVQETLLLTVGEKSAKANETPDKSKDRVYEITLNM